MSAPAAYYSAQALEAAAEDNSLTPAARGQRLQFSQDFEPQ